MNGLLFIAGAFHFASTLLLTGTISFRYFMAAPAFRAKAGGPLEDGLRIRLTRIVWVALAVAVISGAGWLVFLAAEIGDVSVADAVSQGLPWTVLTQTAFGDAWTLRLGIALLLAVLLLVPATTPGLASATDMVCAMLAAALAGSLAWSGHAAATSGFDGAIHLTSDALHLIAAGAWVGALWPLAILLGRVQRSGDPVSVAVAHQATRRFSIMGMISVAIILTTGVINTYEILGSMALSIATTYNRLLLLKISLFLVMLCVAAVNRQRLTPRLASGGDRVQAIRQLRRNSLVEAGLGVAILIVVAVLGRISPHVHDLSDTANYQVGAIEIDNPWSRAVPKGANVAGGYMTIKNTGSEPDRLVGGSTPVADRFEIHEMSMENGVMKMRPLPSGLEIKPGETVELTPSSHHIMMSDLKQPVEQGKSFKASVRFEKAGEVDVDFMVEAAGASAPSSHGMAHD